MKNGMNTRRWIVLIILGAALTIAGIAELLDEFWSGMGGGLMGVGIMQMIRYLRYNKNPEYKERYDVEVSDERNKFLAMKAWSWAGYIYVMAAAVGTIVFRLVGREELMMFCSMSVCFVLLAYWISYMVLKKKY